MEAANNVEVTNMLTKIAQSARRAKRFKWIGVLLLVVSITVKAHAFTPAITPIPLTEPTPAPHSISDSFDVNIFSDGKWSLLGKEMVALHENGCYFDGALMFIPLSDFVEQNPIPGFRLTEDFNYHVIPLDADVSFDVSHTIYNEKWEKILPGEHSAHDWHTLESGKYLMTINVYASDEEKYANTKSLFWLIVGDYEDEEFVPVFTPTAAPSPTPIPTVNSSSWVCWFLECGESEPAYESEQEKFTYRMLEDGNYALVAYKGNNSHVDIPEQYNGRDITEVGRYAFSDNAHITSITFPESINKIGEWAFAHCTSLNNVTLPSSLTSIGQGAFSGCEALEKIDIPEGVCSIEKDTFAVCMKLSRITLPSTIRFIGAGAFEGCFALNHIEFPEGLYSIGNAAFRLAPLRNVILPRSLQLIEEDAFDPFEHSFLVYQESYSEIFAQINGLPYNVIGENFAEKYVWLPSLEQLDISAPQLRVKLLNEKQAFFALWDPQLKESYEYKPADLFSGEFTWRIDFQDQKSGERFHLWAYMDTSRDVTTRRPEEMVTKFYYSQADNQEIAMHALPVQRYGQWLIWNVTVPSIISQKPDRLTDFSFFNVAEFEITILDLYYDRFEQRIITADECIITPATNN